MYNYQIQAKLYSDKDKVNAFSAGTVFRRQNLLSKGGPCTEIFFKINILGIQIKYIIFICIIVYTVLQAHMILIFSGSCCQCFTCQ